MRMELVLGRTLATGFDLGIKIERFEGIALTWPTRQVVLWSDHKTAARQRLLVEAWTIRAEPPNEREEISMAIATINPATGEVVKSFEPLTGAQIEQ